MLVSKTLVLGLLTVLSIVHSVAQESKEIFLVPTQYVNLLFVEDPACPVRILNVARIEGYKSGALRFGYTLQNVSNENVENFEIREVNWFGNKGHTGRYVAQSGQPFFPTMTYATLTDVAESSLSNLNRRTAEELGFSKLHNRIWVAMIVKVNLASGKSYDASTKFKDLEKFIDGLDVDSTTPMAQADLELEKLRNYLSTFRGDKQ